MTLNLTSIEWTEPSVMDQDHMQRAYNACRAEMGTWTIVQHRANVFYVTQRASLSPMTQAQAQPIHTFATSAEAQTFVHMRGIRAAVEYFIPPGGP